MTNITEEHHSGNEQSTEEVENEKVKEKKKGKKKLKLNNTSSLPYVCSVCPKTFKYVHFLRNHLKIHSIKGRGRKIVIVNSTDVGEQRKK